MASPWVLYDIDDPSTWPILAHEYDTGGHKRHHSDTVLVWSSTKDPGGPWTVGELHMLWEWGEWVPADYRSAHPQAPEWQLQVREGNEYYWEEDYEPLWWQPLPDPPDADARSEAKLAEPERT